MFSRGGGAGHSGGFGGAGFSGGGFGGRGGGADRGGGRGRAGATAGSGGGPAGGAPGSDRFPPYLRDREDFEKFLVDFKDPETGARTYHDWLNAVARRESQVFPLQLDHLALAGHADLSDRIAANALQYVEELSAVIDSVLPHADALAARGGEPFLDDAIDVIAADAARAGAPLPADLMRRYELVLLPLTAVGAPAAAAAGGGRRVAAGAAGSEAKVPGEAVPIRALKASSIGALTTIRGVCVSATAVRPRLQLLTSVCELCAEATFQTVSGDRVTPQLVCKSSTCETRQAAGRLMPQYRASRFVEHQELRLQELPGDVPRGATPRTLRVICEGSSARIATPGQTVRVIGVFMPDPSTGAGAEAFRASTMVKTLYKAVAIDLDKQTYSEAAQALQSSVDRARADPDRAALVEKLGRSIAPEIWGMDSVKKALLCLLVGGAAVANGAVIRSDINVLLMGDPGVAKSQLLKWVAGCAPRSVFTTGKGSSGVGLTAAVSRDPNTGETTLEGGALVLADRGICAIDEFDKMDETDRTALHEVMEQQSVSVAKAGIITTLNARTSVLAAANPRFGRWKRSAPPSENVNLPPALLSRFDILWVLLDAADRDRDADLSMHITQLHVYGVAAGRAVPAGGDAGGDEMGNDYFSMDFLRAFIGEARRIDPVIDDAAAKHITDLYVDMRRSRQRQHAVVTPRTLLSLVRISQSLARMRFSARVTESDAREAARLLEASKSSLATPDAAVANRDGTGAGAVFQSRHGRLSTTGIFGAIKDLAAGQDSVALAEVRQALLMRGVTEAALRQCIDTYEGLGVVARDPTGDKLSFMPGM